MSTTKPIGQQLAEARQAARLSVAAAAAELGVDRTTLFRWEQGSRQPGRFVLPVLRDAVTRWTKRAENQK